MIKEKENDENFKINIHFKGLFCTFTHITMDSNIDLIHAQSHILSAICINVVTVAN